MQRIIALLTMLSILLGGCATQPAQQAFYAACASYSAALIIAADARKNGKLSPRLIADIDAANAVVIGDLSHNAPGICTQGKPPSDFINAAALVTSRMVIIHSAVFEGERQ